MIRGLNLAVMFLLEIAVYVCVCYWGLTLDAALVVRVLAGVGGAALLAVVWGLLGAPKARRPVRGLGRLLLEVLWFGAGVLALAAAGPVLLAGVFAAVFVTNAALRAVWRQSPFLPGGTTLGYDG